MESLADLGYPGLFLAAFLAATILPLSSEAALGLLLLGGWPPAPLVAVATLGNVLGACVNYALGYWGSKALASRVLRVSDAEFEQAEARFRRYGLASLLLAWVPVIGDPLTLIAGALRVNPGAFLVLVSVGKLGRYLALAYWLPVT